MMDNQCANIFSTNVTVYGSHNDKFAFIERQNIFLHVYPQLSFFFLNLVCVFLFIPTPLFFPKTFFPKNCFIFPIFIRGEIFLTFFVLRGSCCSSQGELSLFSFTLLRMFSVYLLIRQSLSIRDKKGEKQMKRGNLVCFVVRGSFLYVRAIDCIQVLHCVFTFFVS